MPNVRGLPLDGRSRKGAGRLCTGVAAVLAYQYFQRASGGRSSALDCRKRRRGGFWTARLL